MYVIPTNSISLKPVHELWCRIAIDRMASGALLATASAFNNNMTVKATSPP